jgi:hypothetical protein
MHKSATMCNEIQGKWCKNKHGASKIIDTFETYQVSLRPVKLGPIVILVKIRVYIVCQYCNMYRIPLDPRDLATYIEGPGEDGEGQIESKSGLYPRLLFDTHIV